MGLSLVKRALIGRPLPTHRLVHERLNKVQGLAVFSSDNLSSSAYASEEILLALTAAGAAGLTMAWPVALAITAVFSIVGFSYYQTIHAYPSGGGAYIVARSNLGVWPGLTAAAALLIDYILTVSVSVAAGIAAITSAAPGLFAHRVLLALAAVALIALINLRGVRESGTIFSIPTYFFVVMMFAMLALGLLRGLGTPAIPPRLEAAAAPLAPVTLMLLLRAFASGSAAMTGVEAISNGVQAFRPPESRNAGLTLIWMVAILSSMFLGITYLARHFGIVPHETETVVSQLARTVFGSGSAPYYLMQAGTALILILAANTSFADFPRLSSILARDRFLPHQLANLGDRLVFANGIFTLALLSGILLYVFDASTHRLIPLYAVGVFLSFTLSQAGMVKKWWTERGRGWKHSLFFNGLGAVTTAVILVVVALAKFVHGAWIIAVLVPAIIWVMRSIHLHYRDVAGQLTLEQARLPVATLQHKVVVPVAGINRGVLPALRYAKSLSDDVTAIMVDVDPRDTAEVRAKWERWGMGVPLKVLPSPFRSVLRPFLAYLDDLEWEVGFDQQLTVVLPEFVPARWWQFLLHNQSAFLLKTALYFRRRQGTRVTVVSDVPYYLAQERPVEPDRFRAGPTPFERALTGALALLAVGALGLILALVLHWALIYQAVFGLLVLAALALAAGIAFVRTLYT
jgi:amino acid transporter